MEVACLNSGHSGRVKPGAWINGTSSCSESYLKPIYKHGEVILEVECGENKGLLYLSRLCQGSRGPCIQFGNGFLTPNEFQYVSGRETAKDWKRSIRHHGKSIKLLLSKGLLCVHPTVCDCPGCKTNGQMSRPRSAYKRSNPKECRYNTVFPTSEPMQDGMSTEATSSDKDEHNIGTGRIPHPKGRPQRPSKLLQIIENLRSSREKDVSEQNDEGIEPITGCVDYSIEPITGCVDYSAQVHFQDLSRSPSTSPNSVYTPTIEQLNWAVGFTNGVSDKQRSQSHDHPWKHSTIQTWVNNNKRRIQEDILPLDLSVKKHKSVDEQNQSDSWLEQEKLGNGFNRSLTYRKKTTPSRGIARAQSRSRSQSPQSDSNLSDCDALAPSQGIYPLRVPSLSQRSNVSSDGDNNNSNSKLNNHIVENDTGDNEQIDHHNSSFELNSSDLSNGSWADDRMCPVEAANQPMDDWNIDDVSSFVNRTCGNEDIVKKFRKQHVDGRSLRLLTVDHLVGVLAMKLGPAIRLRAEISKICGKCDICQHCVHCHDGESDKGEKTST